MTPAAFKKGLARAWLELGFSKRGSSLRRDRADVSVRVAFEKGFGAQWFVVVGFWLHALGARATDRFERTHLYFRLERLVPDSRELVLTAGALDDPAQPAAYETLVERVRGDIGSRLAGLATEAGLREAWRASQLAKGLVCKEAREYLESSH